MPAKLRCSGLTLDLSERTYIMGVLNVTPDSFSDGGLHTGKEDALRRAMKMAEEGADIIDVGGESTRPGSEPVPEKQEIERTVPVIKEISKKLGIPVSIDTYKSAVAERALEAGASIINDISGLRFDPLMPEVAERHKAAVILMHIKGAPRDMQKNPSYEALLPEIMDYLREGIRLALSFGIGEDSIAVDPGIGFGKTFDHNLEIIKNLSELRALQRPIVVGPSRKAFLGRILDGAPATERLEGTAAAVTASILNGANILRVHDVGAMKKIAKTADAIKRGRI